MSVFTFAFLAVLVGGCVHLADTWIKHRSKRSTEMDEEFSGALETIEALEERVRVLERIVTESKIDLKRQIDGL